MASSSSDPERVAPGAGGAFDAGLLARIGARVVGRDRELESVVAALAARRHLLLEGPPGTGKSTILRSVAEEAGIGFEFVEGNAELTPARLVGVFDPAAVLTEGYSPEVFVDGPLLRALRNGSLLYVEEINRIPEETLNVLITVMSEGEVHVPRLGPVRSTSGFRLVAAMNPFDAVGTARIAAAVYDRCCRLAVGYQGPDDEVRIVDVAAPGAAESLGAGTLRSVVDLVRATRDHPDVRTGSSVRGAIDLALVAEELGTLRGQGASDPGVTLDAALLALSGRIRVREGSSRSAEEVVRELWERFLGPPVAAADPGAPADPGSPGKA